MTCTVGGHCASSTGPSRTLKTIAPSVSKELCLITVRTDKPATALSEQVRDLLPDAVVLQVTEDCAATRTQVLTKASVAADSEPSFKELFHEYLGEQGTRGAPADHVMRAFESFIDAVDDERHQPFPEESLLDLPDDTRRQIIAATEATA